MGARFELQPFVFSVGAVGTTLMPLRWCVGCQRRHRAARFRCIPGAGGAGHTCHSSYVALLRLGYPAPHVPGHLVLHRHRLERDRTGSRIVALLYREDTEAFRAVFVVMPREWCMAERLCILGIIGQLYWSWPISFGTALLCSRPFPEVFSTGVLLDTLRRIQGMLHLCRVRDGQLARGEPGSGGLSPLQNPSERVCESVRYSKLASDLGAWYESCEAIARELQAGGEGLLSRMLEALRRHPSRGYPARRRPGYGHIRICRLFVYATSARLSESALDWPVCYKCSRHVRDMFNRLNIREYSDALRAVEFMRRLLSMPEYNMSDLTAYVCLMRPGPG